MLSPALALFFDSYFCYFLPNWACQSSLRVPICPAQTLEMFLNVFKICIRLLITRDGGEGGVGGGNTASL